MTRKLDEGMVSEIERVLSERFGDPIVAPRQTIVEDCDCSCNQCGGMMELEGDTCSQCGMMQDTLDQKAPPGREKQVKALKKDPDVDNPFAVAWASYNKSH